MKVLTRSSCRFGWRDKCMWIQPEITEVSVLLNFILIGGINCFVESLVRVSNSDSIGVDKKLYRMLS
ncbi:hypothetical protein [Labilibacter marinus]|uniref:hypothetical protein n=1 Tax=Labilibacter marinus TaxID=1477105 RepID=UPI00117ABAF0|nr:hypothetical protein [Labilibacter marinus]